MKRRAFIQTLGAAAAGGMALPSQLRLPKRLDRIGLELYAVRHEMAKDPEKTLAAIRAIGRSEEHTSELQSQSNLVCRLLLEKKKKRHTPTAMCLAKTHARARRQHALRSQLV